MSLREQILGAKDTVTEAVVVPEWGGLTVHVRGLTGLERDQYEQGLVSGRTGNQSLNLANARARLVALAAVDEQGKSIFTKGDVEALGGKSARALDRIFSVAQRLSGLSREDMEELTKNSSAALNGDSTTV